ncbi:MAG: hypothetical protein EA400_03935 [Chromatiaceae bacterium]|nr:MAG: hypothetical protein EA400_03935 [Chromatiaceae bacterium]
MINAGRTTADPATRTGQQHVECAEQLWEEQFLQPFEHEDPGQAEADQERPRAAAGRALPVIKQE